MAQVEHVHIAVRDGTLLATTLYLPATGEPVPCVLEALPYRKDDLTAGYRPEYVRLRDDHAYAVARVDVRGTGSSQGDAVDEYPAQEAEDLCDVIAWLAGQPWCSGSVGMYGTSYSGFNALHLAAERPPALKAVIAIYSSDDRYTDDVHYMGGALRLLDLVDYPLYMAAMNALPPQPQLWEGDWREEWLRRVAVNEPWLLRWVEEQRDGPYWRQGSLRPAYDRVGCPVMLVGGWADGYRNNTFRTMERLQVPRRLLLGPWSHQATNSSRPGPRIDLVPEMVRWWDRWLRGIDNGVDRDPPITVFARRSTEPQPDGDLVRGEWRQERWPPDRTRQQVLALGHGQISHVVRPDVGTAAWNSCAGALPWGQPQDQRFDDAASLIFEWDGGGTEILGHPLAALRLSTDRPVASISVKLCDVFPDGTSALVTRGLLNLTHRDGHLRPQPVPVNQLMDVEVELEATSWTFDPGHRMRLAIAGTDWPNTVAPPEPVTLLLDLDGSTLALPVLKGPSPWPAPDLGSVEGPAPAVADLEWRVEHDVLRRRTACVVDHGADDRSEHYWGRVEVDHLTFDQRVSAGARFALDLEGVSVWSEARLELVADAACFDVALTVEVGEGAGTLATSSWHRQIPRDLG